MAQATVSEAPIKNQVDTLRSTQFNTNYGINIAGAYTGSALGLNLNPSIYYTFRKNLIALGPNIQRERFNLSGIQGYFQHDLASNLSKMNIYYHINLMYHLSADLKPSSSGPNTNINGTAPKQNTIENYLGFGLRKNMHEQFYLDTSFGVGTYYTINGQDYINNFPLRPESDFSLLIKLGITYDFKK